MDKLNNLSNRAAVIFAIEENGAEFLLEMGRAGGGEEFQASHIHWTIGGSPIDYHNAVVRANLPFEIIDSAIIEVREKLKQYGVPGSWHVGETMQPANLGEYLQKHGFVYGGYDVGMAVDLHTMNDAVSSPATLEIKRVRSEEDLQVWTQTLQQGFGEGEREAQWVQSIYRKIGLGDETHWRHYTAWQNGESVATASMFFGAGVAGIYFVMTIPSARRQGIGAAITQAALKEARELGFHVGVLGSSEMGFPVYQRLGFVEFCRIHLYEWKPV